MQIRNLSCVCFSPTGTTKAVAETIAQGMGAERLALVDATRRSQRPPGEGLAFDQDLVILAVPVYYGRVPEEAVAYLNSLSARRVPAVIVVVYGNRAFDDALIELKDIAVARGFIPVAGGAFIGEHSFSFADRPIAHGRPDEADLAKAREFGAAVREKLRRLPSVDAIPLLTVPGNVPYVEPTALIMTKAARKETAFTPETDLAMCTRCGECAQVCPTGAIDPDDVTRTDRWRCLICFACIKACPEGARQMKEPHLETVIARLHETCQARKEPEVFM